MAGNFNISYVFNAKDKFSAVGRKVSRSIENIGKSAKQIPAKLKKSEASVKKLALSTKSSFGNISNNATKSFSTIGVQSTKAFNKITVGAISVKVPIKNVEISLKNLAKRASATFKKLAKSAKELGTTLSISLTLPIVFFANKFVQAASDAAETASKFKTTFRDIGDSSEEAATKLAKNFLLTKTDAKKLLAGTGDLLTGFQFSQKSALKLSVQVQGLAADLASFNNLEGGTVRASDAITKGLLGETEGLKALGVVINQDLIKKKILQEEAKGVVFETVQQAKAIATLALIVEQSGNAIGDVGRTSKDFANLQRTMNNRLTDVSETLGVLLLPFAIKLVTKIADLAEKFNKLSPRIKKIILIVAALVALVGPLLLLFAGVVAVFGVLTTIAGALATAIGFLSLVTGIAVLPLLLIIAAVGLVVAAFFFLKNNWTDVVTVIGGTIEQIMINFGLFKDSIVNFISSIGDSIKSFLSGPIELFKKSIDFAKGLFGFDGESKITITNKEIKSIKPLADILPSLEFIKKPELPPIDLSVVQPKTDPIIKSFLSVLKTPINVEGGTLPTGDNLNARDSRLAVDNNLSVTVAAEKGTQVKAIKGTKGNGMRLGKSMEAAI